jgi:hypothetical protein
MAKNFLTLLSVIDVAREKIAHGTLMFISTLLVLLEEDGEVSEASG